MRRLFRRGAPTDAVAGRPLLRALAEAVAMVMVAAAAAAMTYPPILPQPAASPAASNPAGQQQIILPDLLLVAPKGLSAAQITKIGKVSGVRSVITADGAAIKIGTQQVNVLGVDPQQYRSWTPLATASDQGLWTALASGRFVASPDAAKRLGLRPGARYGLTGAAQQNLVFGGSAALGVSGIDVLVSNQASGRLGLVRQVAALISAPGAGLAALTSGVRAAAGTGATIVSLRGPQLPVDPVVTGGKPASYLQLFQQSAATYCPGLSWTVLAAIGQIESGDGQNVGPSTAGALGPMQFLPSTWATWGITAFGETGPPDIMDPYDAVPSAARLLCADGAGTAAGLAGAIYSYNHSSRYVTEVLALARQYAQTYG
jgi:transglycosylase-like protein with SLT domain